MMGAMNNYHIIPPDIDDIVPGDSLPEYLPLDIQFTISAKKLCEFKTKVLHVEYFDASERENNEKVSLEYIYYGLYYSKDNGRYYRRIDIDRLKLEEDSHERFNKKSNGLGECSSEISFFITKETEAKTHNEKVHNKLFEVYEQHSLMIKNENDAKAAAFAKKVAKAQKKKEKEQKKIIRDGNNYNGNWTGMNL